MNILIIEDEIKTAKELKSMIEELRPQSNVYALAHSLDDAERILLTANKQPDLIFSDIQLGDGLCFDLFERISIQVPIIFFTAYDQYALNAFRNNGIDYLLKPVQEGDLRKSFQKLDNLTQKNEAIDFSALKRLLKGESATTFSKTMLVYYKEKIIPLPVDEIVLIKTENNRLLVMDTSKESFVINKTLEEVMEKLDPAIFNRANRQYIVNSNFIKNMENLSSRKLLITMEFFPKEFIQVSKERLSSFLEWVEN
ncbi:MAG TPA: LytTR family DNA-binding domain-containing protein [Chitinophagales bacterium]|nr:LytTR family DNA-binding domain-containing protein [Chitinophagales bacterium]